MKTTVRHLLVLFPLLLIQAKRTAQTTNAIIIGRLADEGNMAAPDIIMVPNVAAGFSTTILANSKGEYAFVQLPTIGLNTTTIRSVGSF